MAEITAADLTTDEKIALRHGRGLWRSQAIEGGTVPIAALDQSTTRMLNFLNRIATAKHAPPNDQDAHHHLAQNIATESIVLLQNDGTLPLPKANFRLLIIGEGATNPTIQGSDSASTRPTRVDIPLDEIRARLAITTHLPFTATPAEINAEIASHPPRRHPDLRQPPQQCRGRRCRS